jgi:ribosomal protein S18 acetylase RimI-like enzyme
MTGVAVRPLAVVDLAVAARLHAALLPHGFFAFLGLRYLRAYYGTFLASPHAIGLVAELEGRPVGILVGTSRNAAHYRWVMRHRGPRLACLGASAMLVRPAVAVWFLRTRVRRYGRRVVLTVLARTRRGGNPAPTDAAGGDTAVLTHVMVADQARGRGAGAALVDRFAAAAKAAGARTAVLVTLAGEDGAGFFYKRLGWEHLEDRGGRDGHELSVFSRRL